MKATSVGDMMRRSIAEHGARTAFLVPLKEGFSPVTYTEMEHRVRLFAGALRSLGIKRGDRIAIMSENCIEWALTDWACQCLGIVLVPIYPTLPPDQAEYIVRDCTAKIVFVGSTDIHKKLECLRDVVLLMLRGTPDSLAKLAEAKGGELSKEDLNREIDSITLEDLATIIYTSGTTGLPKGAMLPHRAVLHVCEAAKRLIPLDEKDLFLSFLPQSHVYERIAGQFLPISLGACVAFSKSLASLAGDMMKVRPTVMLCVPRFLDSLRERVLDNVAKQSPMRQKLFYWALAQGVKRAKGQFAPFSPLLDKLVMSKIRERTGGRMRYFVSGGAALPAHVAEFYMAAGLTVLQGYGLTETTGGTFVNHPARNKYWTVGETLEMESKIAEDGEILVRGPALMTGYLNLPDETAAAIDSEGWFHTGDIGEFEGKNLKITDRKKDLIVLANGKNVAPQPIETKLKASTHIAEAVVFGDGLEYVIALIVPNYEHVRKALAVPEEVMLSSSPEARALIKREIDSVNKTLPNFELVKRFAILDQPFSVESGEITPTLKVKRRVVREKYAPELAALSR